METERYIMIYNIKNTKNNLRILGKEFVENNKNKAKLIINNKKYNLTEFNPVINYAKQELKINIILNQNNLNKSCMFMDCISLISVSIYEDKENIKNPNDKSLKDEEEYLLGKYFGNEIKNISTEKNSELNTYSEYSLILEKSENISDKSTIRNLSQFIPKERITFISFKDMFRTCISLVSLPDISHWNTRNVFDMSRMFANCFSLKSLPDISKWDVSNVKYI